MDNQLATVAIALALAWASGIRLYAVLFLIGLAGHFHWYGWHSPQSLAILSHPIVLGANGLLLLVEFFADKIPGLDSIWDAAHTFVRIPAGALLAAGVIGAEEGSAWALAAGLIGGSITAGTHFTKAAGRLAINASPEPISNWLASFSEDAAVLSGMWLALQYPSAFLALLALFIILICWLLPKLFKFLHTMLRRIAAWLALDRATRSG